MLVGLEKWILNICTAVFFITAVEMILPNNDFKKYAKFVLGIILITVFLNPIIKIFDSNFNIAIYSDSFSNIISNKEYSNSLQEYKDKNIVETLKVFEENLKLDCEKKLKEKYPQDSFNVSVNAFYNDKKENYEVKSIKIGIKEGSIERIKKIQIGSNVKSVDSLNSEVKKQSTLVKTYISNELNLSMENIEVYEL